MSRAFIKEDSGSQGDDSHERPHSPGPNYVTPAGRKALEERLDFLSKEIASIPLMTEDLAAKARRARLERDFRYYQKRLDCAVVVDNSKDPPAEVRFGASVEAEDDRGRMHFFSIVGDDEAEARTGKISWGSPLAEALFGLKAGEQAAWEGPEGASRLTVKSVRY
ncbi:MAG: GreA/GreB family elongation factor [Elusimicrobia bacterium]|nr:GreA/GreB family elongation factor [Elusimicrobiota bacterium]